MAEAIAAATYKDANGVDQPSPNKWQALYILGQIHDARRQPGEALTYYEQVAERFTDAAGAVKALTRKDAEAARGLGRPARRGPEGRGRGRRPPRRRARAATPRRRGRRAVKLDYRNIAEADVKVYPVDLMRLYLTRRNLDAIAGIDLAGITPLLRDDDQARRRRRLRRQDSGRSTCPLKKEGAYLVMVRGDDLYASGIVLVTPLELEVLEEPESGRVRVTVRDARTKAFVPKVQVKVIGSRQPGVPLGRDRPARRLRRRGGPRPGHGRGPQGARTSTPSTAARPSSARPRPPRTPRPRPSRQAGQQPRASPDLQQNVRGQNRSTRCGSSSGWRSATRARTRA